MFVVVIVSFLPNILSVLFRYLGIPTISGLLNLSYAIDSDSFLWPQCGGVCVMLLLLLVLLEKEGMALLKRRDIYWK